MYWHGWLETKLEKTSRAAHHDRVPDLRPSRFERASLATRAVEVGVQVDGNPPHDRLPFDQRPFGAPADHIPGRGRGPCFLRSPSEDKRKPKAPFAGYPYGYPGAGVEALAKSKGADMPPDSKVVFIGGRLPAPAGLSDPEALAFCYAATLWPPAPAGFVDAWKAYLRLHLEDLASRSCGSFAVARPCGGRFRRRHRPAGERPARARRVASDGAALSRASFVLVPRTRRTGSLTILLPEAKSGGLEI